MKMKNVKNLINFTNSPLEKNFNKYRAPKRKEKEQDLSLSFHFMMAANRPMFTDYWEQRMAKYCFKLHYYQIAPILCESCTMASGRRVGKSTILESCIKQDAINAAGEEIMLAAHRESQIDQRERRVQKAFIHNKFFNQFLLTKKKKGSIILGKSVYEYKLAHAGTIFMGKAGEKDFGETIVGFNPIHKYIEEAGFFLKPAYDRFSKTQSVRGATTRLFGTCDIITPDSPLYMADTKWHETFAHARFHIPQLFERRYSISDHRNDMDVYGSENDPRYRNLVCGEFAAFYRIPWDLDAIRKCCIEVKDYYFYKKIITGELYSESHSPKEFLDDLPKINRQEFDKIGIGMDVGLIHTSVILIFAHHIKKDKWFLVAVIYLVERVISDYQAEILDHIMDFYNNSWAGVDITNNPAIATTLKNKKNIQYIDKKYEERIIEIMFSKKITVGHEVDPATKNLPEHKKKYKKKEADMKAFSTIKLDNMFKKESFVIPKEFEDELISEFETEIESTSITTGRTTIRTPENIHIPEAFRCFSIALHIESDLPGIPERKDSEFCMPEVGASMWH